MPETRVGAVVPDVPLRDAFARPLSLQHGGGPAVVSFASTRCTDACPLVTAKFARLERLLAGTPVRLVEITLDPGHDMPAVLRR